MVFAKPENALKRAKGDLLKSRIVSFKKCESKENIFLL